MSLTKDQILAAKDIQIEKAMTPEWGGDGHVYLRTMAAGVRCDWEVSLNDGEKRNMERFRARLLVLCLCDKDGKLLFTPADAVPLAERSALIVNRLFDLARAMNGLGDKDIEELKKNLEGGQDAASPTASPCKRDG